MVTCIVHVGAERFLFDDHHTMKLPPPNTHNTCTKLVVVASICFARFLFDDHPTTMYVHVRLMHVAASHIRTRTHTHTRAHTHACTHTTHKFLTCQVDHEITINRIVPNYLVLPIFMPPIKAIASDVTCVTDS